MPHAESLPDATPESPVTIPFQALTFRPKASTAPLAEEPTDDEWERLAVQDGLFNAIQKYGAPRVMRWVRNLAAIAGQGVE